MTTHASGSFNVEITPQEQESAENVSLGRMSLDKQFHGDLQATSKGTMLTAGAATGSAAYVAIERVTGTLHGRSGSFVLLHNGAMTRESQQLTITVVRDSGTGALSGIAGEMAITIEGGRHSYDFDYTLPAEA
jgi:hypothetical protein